MSNITYKERVTIVFNPDGTVKGSETHVHTGYFEARDVPDAPDGSGTQVVFQVVKQEVRAVEAGDLEDALNEGCQMVEDAAAKAAQIAAHAKQIEDLTASLEQAASQAAISARTIEEQTSSLSKLRAELAEAQARETKLSEQLRAAQRQAA